MTEYEMNVVMTAKQQLFTSVPMNVLMSWGISRVAATKHDGKPTLVLQVEGFLHKGPVLICYNATTDLYDIILMKGGAVEKRRDDVYADELGGVIDRMVEKDCSQEEYEKKVEQSLIS